MVEPVSCELTGEDGEGRVGEDGIKDVQSQSIRVVEEEGGARFVPADHVAVQIRVLEEVGELDGERWARLGLGTRRLSEGDELSQQSDSVLAGDALWN